MIQEFFTAHGWSFEGEFQGSWILKKGIYTMQYLFNKKTCYIAQEFPYESVPQVIYRGKMENENQFNLVMDLLFIENVSGAKHVGTFDHAAEENNIAVV